MTSPGGASGIPRFFSFAAGVQCLVFEVLWIREFTFLFGASAIAFGTTLAATFLGLAFGGEFFGRRSAGARAPLCSYGGVVGLAGVTALLVPLVIRAAQPFVVASGAGELDLLLRTAACAVALFLPAFLMGGTLPFLVQRESLCSGARRSAGALYAWHTAGAACGCLAVPYLLLPRLGLDGSQYLAVGASLAIGGSAFLLERRHPAPPAAAAAMAQVPAPPSRADPGSAVHPAGTSTGSLRPHPWIACAFAAGLLDTALEVWLGRMHAQVHENSIYSFALVIAAFLVGLGLGAPVASWFGRGKAPTRVAVARIWTATGLGALVVPVLFSTLTSGMESLGNEGGFVAGQWRLAGIVLLTTVPVGAVCGAVLPTLLKEATQAALHPGRAVGTLLLWNTLGSVFGPLLALYLLPSRVGIWGCWVAASLAFLVLAEVVRGLPARGSLSWRRAVPAVAAIALGALTQPWNLPRVHLRDDPQERLVEIREGAHGIVAVVEDDFSRRIKLNNHYTLGGTAATGDCRQLAHLPLLLHRAPRRVAFLGLGTGLTAGAVVQHPVEHVVILELVPEVVDAARACFSGPNLGVLEDPRVEVVRRDACSYLLHTDQRFDVIVGDLAVPWRSGESALYTLEHFRAARRALDSGGVYCQWLPLYQLGAAELRSVVATFVEVFGACTLWRGDLVAALPTLGLVGVEGAQPIDVAQVDARAQDLVPRVDALNPYLADPSGAWLFLLGALQRGDEWLAGAPFNSVRRPRVELTGARGAHAGFSGPALEEFLARLRTQPLDKAFRRWDALHSHWVESGGHLFRASELARQQRFDEASELGMKTLDALPPALKEAVLHSAGR